MRSSPAHVEEDIREGSCKMANIPTVTFAREIIVEILLLSQRTRIIAETAKSPSTEAVTTDRWFYERHGDWTDKCTLINARTSIAAKTQLEASTMYRLWRRWLDQRNVSSLRAAIEGRVAFITLGSPPPSITGGTRKELLPSFCSIFKTVWMFPHR